MRTDRLMLLAAIMFVWGKADAAPLVTHNEWAKTHAHEELGLRWDEYRMDAYDIEIRAEHETTIEVTFTAALKVRWYMDEMAVAMCAIGVRSGDPATWPKSGDDRADIAPQIPGAFWRKNLLAKVPRAKAHGIDGSDFYKYGMVHISSLHVIPRGDHRVEVSCRARNGNMPNIDGTVVIDQDPFDAYRGTGPQSQLIVRVW